MKSVLNAFYFFVNEALLENIGLEPLIDLLSSFGGYL